MDARSTAFPAPLPRVERQVADAILRLAPVTKAELVAETGFTQQYISRVTGQLLDAGFCFQCGETRNERGQSAASLAISGKAAFSVGLSLMTDSLVGVAIDLSGCVMATSHRRISTHQRQKLLDIMAEMVTRLLDDAGLNSRQVIGMGLSATGYFVGEGRQVNPPDPLGELAFVDLEQLLSEETHLPVILDNDGNAAASAERLLGIGKWAKSFAYLFMSKGLGGGLVIDGQPFRGAHGNAGEFANIIPTGDYYPTLQTLLHSVNSHGADYADIGEMLAQLDPANLGIVSWLDDAVGPMNQIISAIAAVFDPDAIALGGRLPKDIAMRLAERISIYNATRKDRPKPVCRIVPAETEGDAAAMGAAMLPFRQTIYL